MSSDQLSMFGEESPAPDAPPTKFKSFTVSLSRTLQAPAEKIFDRWLIPTFVGSWMFGEHLGNEKLIDLQNEVRPGGTYEFKIKRGGREVLHDGEYLEIDRPKKLSFSWRETAKKTAHKSKVSLSLSEQDGKTKLKLSLQIDQTLELYGDEIKQQWSLRLKALSDKLSK